MDTPSKLTRTLIRQNLKERLELKFSVAKGTTGQWFREVRARQWTPGNVVRPCLWISDNGARRSDSKLQSDAVKCHTLALSIVLDLVADWEKQTTQDDWSDRVERIVKELENYQPAGGVFRAEKIADNPYEVVLQAGGSEKIWEIEMEYEYFMDVREFGTSDV